MEHKEIEQEAIQLVAISTLLVATLRELQEAIRITMDQEVSQFYSALYTDVGRILQKVVDKMNEIAGGEDTFIVNL
jgi:hypothetical protein